jgi:hypothetical protein
MEVEFGKVVDNKTKGFLVPGLKAYGSTFTAMLSNDIWKLAFGIHDTLLDESEILVGRHPIFIMCDKAVRTQNCLRAIEYLTNHHSYLSDYSCDTLGRKHMVVLDYPKELHQAYDYFLEGKYSQMFTSEELDIYFPDKKTTDIYKILTKDKTYMSIFIAKIEEMFNVKIEDKAGYITSELEFPFRMCTETCKTEVFNFNYIPKISSIRV